MNKNKITEEHLIKKNIWLRIETFKNNKGQLVTHFQCYRKNEDEYLIDFGDYSKIINHGLFSKATKKIIETKHFKSLEKLEIIKNQIIEFYA